MERYIDGFVLPIAKKSLKAYMKTASEAGKVWMEYGALEYTECVSEDVKEIPNLLSFPKMSKVKKDEVVFFSFIAFKSRAHRDQVNKKVMADPRIQNMTHIVGFDTKRMAYGGFKSVVRFEKR